MSADFGSSQPNTGPGELRQSVNSGMRWSFVAMSGRQLGRVAFAFLLARLLGPTNYGIIGQATVYIAFTALFLDQGFGAALIQRKRLGERDIGSVFWLNMISAGAVALLTVAIAPLIAEFFRSPELTSVLRILAVGVIFKGLAVVPTALLTRRLQFRSLAFVEVTGVVISGAVGVAVAVAGGEYWALVAQVLTLDLVFAVGVFISAGIPELRGSIASLRDMWRFSSRVMGSEVLNYGSRNLDNVLIGRVLGATPLAYYSIAYRMLLLPLQMLTMMVSRVCYPLFSRLQEEPERLGQLFLQATRTLATVAFPAMTLVIVSAPDAVPLVLGPSWKPAALPMQILAVTAMRQSVLFLAGDVFMACGRSDWRFRFSIVSTVVLAVSFTIGLPWGIVGVAIAYSIGDALLHPVVILAAGRLAHFRTQDYYANLLPGVAGAFVFAGAWLAARMLWELTNPGAAAGVIVATCTLFGGAVTLVLLVSLWPADVHSLFKILPMRPGPAHGLRAWLAVRAKEA